MEFDCGGDYNYNDGIQEEFWDDGFDNASNYHQGPAPEPRTQFKMPWQAVLSLQVLPGGKVQASVRHWPKTLVDSARYDPDRCYPRTIPCPHCKFYCPTHAALAEEKLYHRKMFIDDNQKRAEQTNQKQRRRQRGRQGRNEKKETGARAGDEQELDEVARAIALTSFSSFCDTRPAAEEEGKKRRRTRNKKKAAAANAADKETSTPTTKQDDPWEPAECQGHFQKKTETYTPAEKSPGHPTLDAAPEDTDTTTTTAEFPTSTSPLASLASLSLV